MKLEQIILSQPELLTRVKADSKKFRNENDPIQKSQYFIQFLSSLSDYIANEHDKENTDYYFSKYCKIIADYSPTIRENIPIFFQTMQILISMAYSNPMPEYINTYISFAITGFNFVDQYQVSTNVLYNLIDVIFNTEKLFYPFCIYNGIQLLFHNSFVGNDSKDKISVFAANNIPPLLNLKLIHYIDYESFLQNLTDVACSHIILQQNILNACLFVARLIGRCSIEAHGWPKYFASHDGFVTIDLLLANSSIEDKCLVYSELIEVENSDWKPPPNLDTIAHIKLLFDNQFENQQFFLKVLIETIKNHPDCASNIDEKTPITSWMTMKNSDVLLYLELIEAINQSSPTAVKKALPYLFRTMFSDEKYVEYLLRVLDIFAYQLKNKYMDTNMLLEIGFLAVFVFSGGNGRLLNLLKNSDALTDILCQIYQTDEALSFRNQILKSVCDVVELQAIDNGIKCISSFIADSQDFSSLKFVLDLIERKPSMLHIINQSFIKSHSFCEKFVHNQLNWLVDCFRNQKITEEDFLTTISYISHEIHFEEVDKEILNLMDENLLKLENKEVVELAAYGRNIERRLIKVHPLAKFIEIPENLHPYSEAVFGYYNTKTREHPELYNRYISDSDFEILTKEMNFEIIENFDYSPLFYMDSNSSFSINGTFSFISFWFKPITIEDSDFIKAKNIKVSFNDSKLFVKSDEQSMEYEIKMNEWNFIAIQIELYALKVNFNGVSTVFSLLKIDSQFDKISLMSKNSKLFISPAIRISQGNIIEYDHLIRKGPLNINPASELEEETIINCWNLFNHKNPFSDNHKSKSFPYKSFHLKFLTNFFVIPYYGLPAHFMNFTEMSKLFDFIEKSENKIEKLKVALKIFAINKSKQRRFIYRLSRLKDLLDNQELTDFVVQKLDEVFNSKYLIENLVKENCLNERMIESILMKFNRKSFTQRFEHLLCENLIANENLIPIILDKITEFSIVPKFVISLLRIGHLNNYESQQLRIIDIMTEHLILKENFAKIIVDYLPYEYLQNLFLETNDKDKALKIFILIANIHNKIDNYAKFSLQFCFSLMRLKDYKEVWNYILEFQNQKTIPRIAVLHMIWAVLVSSFYSVAFGNGEKHQCEELALTALEELRDNIQNLINTPDCYSFILHMFPHIFYSKTLFALHYESNFAEIEKVEVDDFDQNQITDEFLGTNNVINTIEKPNSMSIIDFIRKDIIDLIDKPEFKNFNAAAIVNYLVDHPLISFISDFIQNISKPSKAVFTAFIFNPYLYDNEIGEIVGKEISHAIFNNAEKQRNKWIKQLLAFFRYKIENGISSSKPFYLVKDLVDLASNIIFMKESLANQFSLTLIAILSQVDSKSVVVIFSIFFGKEETILKIIENCTIKNQWLNVLNQFENSQKLVDLINKMKIRDKEIEELSPKIIYENSQNEVFNSFISFISSNMKQNLTSLYHAKCKSFILLEYFKRFISTTKFSNVEYWSEDIKFNSVLSKTSKFIPQFSIDSKQPKYEIFDNLSNEENYLDTKITNPDENCNVLERFLIEFGRANVYFNVCMIRSKNFIMSVCFMYHDAVVFLLGAQIEDNNELKFVDYDKNFVMKEVFNSTFGSTVRFFSSIVLMIEKKSILSILKLSDKSIGFWTIKNGHFVISCSPNDIQRSDKYVNDIISFANTKIEELANAYEDLKNGKIETEEFVTKYNILHEHTYANSDITVINQSNEIVLFDLNADYNDVEYKNSLVSFLAEKDENLENLSKYNKCKYIKFDTLSSTKLPLVFQIAKENPDLEYLSEKSKKEYLFTKSTDYSAKIDGNSLRVTFYGKDEQIVWRDSLLQYAIHVSSNKEFCSVCTKIGIILVFRIVCNENEGLIYNVSQIECNSCSESALFADEFLLAHHNGRELMMTFFPICQTIESKIFDDEICSIHFIDTKLFVVCNFSLNILDFKLNMIKKFDFANKTICSCHCGLSHFGGIIVCHKNNEISCISEEIHKSKVSADAKIVSLQCDKDGHIACCKLSSNKNVIITAQCLGGNAEFISSNVENCNICGKHSHHVCPSCLRSLCSKCYGRDTICPLCLEFSLQQSQK